MSQALVSVIVPVYNVEAYLGRCVDSLLAQTYSALEIFLIDDGSTDDSGRMCEAYARQDNRVQVIHQENHGLSHARNRGLDRMGGEWVAFVDSDDFVEPTYIQALYETALEHDASLSICGFSFMDDLETEFTPNGDKRYAGLLSREKALILMFYQQGYDTAAWGKLYRASLFEGIRYPVGRLHEDLPVTYRLFDRVDHVGYSPATQYYYRMRPGGIQNSPFNRRKLDLLWHCQEVVRYAEQQSSAVYLAAICRYMSVLFRIFGNTYGQPEYGDITALVWGDIRRYRKQVLWDGHARKKTRAACLASYFGRRAIHTLYKASASRI